MTFVKKTRSSFSRSLPSWSIAGILASSISLSSTACAEDSELHPCPDSPNCVLSAQTDKDNKSYIEPLSPVKSTNQTVIEKIAAVIKDMKRVEIVKQTDQYLHAEFTSAVFRFVDDVEFLQTEDGTIHVRSASRVGHSDFGVNRKRVEKIRELLVADN